MSFTLADTQVMLYCSQSFTNSEFGNFWFQNVALNKWVK